MKQTLYILGMIAVVLWLVTGCQPEHLRPQRPATASAILAPSLHRIVDQQAGVVCFYMHTTTGAAIDCLPIRDTLLDQPSR